MDLGAKSKFERIRMTTVVDFKAKTSTRRTYVFERVDRTFEVISVGLLIFLVTIYIMLVFLMGIITIFATFMVICSSVITKGVRIHPQHIFCCFDLLIY